MNILVQSFFCRRIYLSLLDKYIGVELLVVNFVRNCYTIFQSGCMILQLIYMRVSVAPHPPNILQSKSLFESFQWVYSDISILILICILLITNGVENFFMCLFVICISSLAKFLFKSFTHFLLSCMSYIIEQLFIHSGCKFFLSDTGIMNIYFLQITHLLIFLLDKVQYILFFLLLWCIPSVFSLSVICLPQGHENNLFSQQLHCFVVFLFCLGLWSILN